MTKNGKHPMSKNECKTCKGHGGTYDICPRTGEIMGIPCFDCEDIPSDYQIVANASEVGKTEGWPKGKAPSSKLGDHSTGGL